MGQGPSSQNRGSGGESGDEGVYRPKNGSGNSSLQQGDSSRSSSPHRMEGPLFGCDYLGYKTLPKPATSIAGLQNQVKDLYFLFRKTIQHGGPPKKSSFKVTPAGLLVALHEGPVPLEMFFEISSVTLIEAVRFAVVKGSEKKPKAIFVPLDDNRGPISDKSAFSLEKAFHFLIQSTHPALLVCVLRRPKGVKALDCHVFAMDNTEDALDVQTIIQQLITSGPPPAAGESNFNRGGTRGDFIRTEFGDYNVYRGGQAQAFELKDEYFRGPGGGGGGEGGFPPQLDPTIGPRSGGQPSPRETYPAERSERPRFGWSYDKSPGGDEFRRMPGQYNADAGRPSSGELRPGNQFLGDNRAGGQFPGDRKSGEIVAEEKGGFGGAELEPGYRRVISHTRDRSGDSGDNRVTGLSSKVSSGSDHSAGARRFDEAGGLGRGGGYQDSRYGPISPRSDGPPKVMDKPVSPVRLVGPGGMPPVSPLRSESPRPPASPYTSTSPPPGGALFQDGPACSLSNRESREDGLEEPNLPGKPVAKVPPHLKGVKVLPSDFRAVKLKPKQQRSESDESEPGYDNHKNIVAQYKQLQEQETHQSFTAFDDRDLDKANQSRSYLDNWNDEAPGGVPGSGSGYDPQYRRFPPPEDERRFIEQYSDQDTVQMRHFGQQQQQQQQQQQRYTESPISDGKNRYSAPNYSDKPGLETDWRSKSAYDMGQGRGYQWAGGPEQGPGRGANNAPSSAANDDRQMGRKKDAEIAEMFSNFRVQGREGAVVGDQNNFEESLGYLP